MKNKKKLNSKTLGLAHISRSTDIFLLENSSSLVPTALAKPPQNIRLRRSFVITKIFVFGNIDLERDSLPLRILPRLKEKFPDIIFEEIDPNEDWVVPEEVFVIDTIIGIKEIKIFYDLDVFSSAPRVGVHDFDALTNLRYFWKLGKIKKITIIGIPSDLDEEKAFQEVSITLEDLK